jgi:hypothetical protein
MSRRTFVYDHDLDAMVQIRGPGSNHVESPPGSGMHIIRDIEPYRPVAADVASGGKRPIIGSRSRHREFLRDNRYVETGNEVPVSGERPTLSRAERVEDIRRAMRDW